MDNFISEQNFSEIQNVIKILKSNDESFSKSDVWLVVGSYITNTNTPKSDLDVIRIKDTLENDKPTRTKKLVNHILVSYTVVSKNFFIDDSTSGKYGGYFSGKVLNPHILLGTNIDLKRVIRKSSALLTGDLVCYIASKSKSEYHSKDSLLAITILAYAAFNPEYVYYLFRFYLSEEFELLWDTWSNQIYESFEDTDYILKADKSFTLKEPEIKRNEYDFQCKKFIAYRSAIGVKLHSCNHEWPMNHFNSASKELKELLRQKKTKKKLNEMIDFIHSTASVNNVYLYHG